MGSRNSPRSNRGVYKLKIGGSSVVSRLKISTGDYLGLTKESELLKGKKTTKSPERKALKALSLSLRNRFPLMA